MGMNASQDWGTLATGDLVEVRLPGAAARVGMVSRIGGPTIGALQTFSVEVIVGSDLLTIMKYNLEPRDDMTPEDEEAFNEMNELFNDIGVWKLGEEGR